MPNLLDIFQDLLFRTGFARVVPTRWNLAVSRPDRILLFIVHDNSIDVFSVFTHFDLLFVSDGLKPSSS